ncbi:MAG TPA: SpoIIE family protein phosphatase [Candidatus Limnocylindria bacterium]|nr:SpoIIE family protein phosphatase [Candidatus Limnocylindria bacterium]
MTREPRSYLLSGLVGPVAAVLVASALSLPLQPYTGLSLREDGVAAVVPGGPGDLAGLRPGDRLVPPLAGSLAWTPALVREAAPDRPLDFVIERDGTRRAVWLAPQPLPDGERRMRAALLGVACGFVLLGGWVWSERRDRLTRIFFLLCLAFAWMLTPIPRFGAPWLALAYDLVGTAAQLALPALLIHFFALFPDPRAPRGRLHAGVRTGYAVAGALFMLSVLALPLQLRGPAGPALLAVLQPVAALWFAAGVLLALGLFARSFARAGSADARRRLAVAFGGCVLGIGPLAVVIVMRNLQPDAVVPGERLAILMTLLVPASFAWATVVHGIFDFRVALQASGGAVALVLVTVAAFIAGEWLGASRFPEHGALLNGAVLAVLALVASLSGPLRPWGRALTERLSRAGSLQSLSEALRSDPAARETPSTVVLERAAGALAAALRLDGCRFVLSGPNPGDWDGELELSPAFAGALAGRRGPLPADDAGLAPEDRAALDRAQVHWVLPVGGETQPTAALLLGRRLGGPWLDRREVAELERLADQLGVTLENVALRRAARTHGAIDRELEEAGAIQAHLLPRRAPVYPSLDCAAAALSCEPVGGDYYDFFERSDREFTLVVGDAAGKGVPAALLLAGVQARFRSEGWGGRNPSQVLHALNLELVHLDQPEKFVGLLCARVDARRGRVCFANAGLTPPLIRRRSGAFEELTAGGTLLGVSADSRYPDASVELRSGDVAVLYTDGLTEARRGEELFGTEGLRAVLEQHAHRRAAHILEATLDAVRRFADRPLDDLTVLVLKQLADPPAAALAAERTPLKWRLASADTRG